MSRAAEAPDARPHESDPLPPPATPKPVLAQTERLAQQRVPVEPELDLATRKLHVAQAKVDDLPQRENPRAPAPREASEQPPDQPVDAATLINRSLAMASLSATIDQRMQAYAQRPRRKWVTARTREHRFAAYMEAWRAKVERIGNLNYPDEARRRRLSGDLLLDVALNPDGTINEIVLRRSSGQKVLDDAAVRIVELSAPFGRFPESFRDEVDILHIERTWRFSSRNHFASR